MRKYLYPLSMIALALAGAAAIVFVAPAYGDDDGVLVRVPAERVVACQEQGGCAFITRAEFMAAQQQAFDAGKAQSKQACRSSI